MHTDSVFNTKNFNVRAQSALVLSLFDGLEEGESFYVVTDRDPGLLCQQLDSFEAPNLHWEFVKKATGQWHLRIAKSSERDAAIRAQGGCCGSCGGSDST